MRLADFGRKIVLCERGRDPVGQVTAVSLVIDMLELASAALRKVTAWRHLMVRPLDQRSVIPDRVAGDSERHMPARRGDSVAACRDPDDLVSHREA